MKIMRKATEDRFVTCNHERFQAVENRDVTFARFNSLVDRGVELNALQEQFGNLQVELGAKQKIIRGDLEKVQAAITERENEVITTFFQLLRRMGLTYRRSCINMIKHDFPNVIPDLSWVKFYAMYGVNTVPYGIPDPVESSKESNEGDDEFFGLEVNFADDVE